jgi:Cof subfamily protein (haloacid dehalogenase superfamily)
MVVSQFTSVRIVSMHPRLMAYDLDGTLCGTDGTLSTRTVAALRQVSELGVQQLIATGRPLGMVMPLLGDVEGVFCGIVGENGAHIVALDASSPHQPRELHREAISLSVALDVIAEFRRHDATLRYALATDHGYFADDGFTDRFPIAAPHGLPPLIDATGTHAMKVAVFSDTDDVLVLLDRLAPLAPTGMRLSHMGMNAAEIGPSHVHKGSGVAWWVTNHGVDPADVWAFGDNLNDHEMFALCGRSICPANADAPTQAVVDEVCAHHGDDGVAQVLERLIADIKRR